MESIMGEQRMYVRSALYIVDDSNPTVNVRIGSEDFGWHSLLSRTDISGRFLTDFSTFPRRGEVGPMAEQSDGTKVMGPGRIIGVGFTTVVLLNKSSPTIKIEEILDFPTFQKLGRPYAIRGTPTYQAS